MKPVTQLFTCKAFRNSPLEFAKAAISPVIVVPIFAPIVIGYARSMLTTPMATIGVRIDKTIELDWTAIVRSSPKRT